MSDLLLVYTTWESIKQAKRAGKHLLKTRLCGCINILGEINPLFWWPPREEKIDESKEVVMIIKTLKSKYNDLEKEICKIHTFDTPCIIALPVYKANNDYYEWLKGEMEFEK